MDSAKLFSNGRSQAVRLPKEYRFGGKEVRVRRYGLGILLEPMQVDVERWFEALDRFDEPFMPEGRKQPTTPTRDSFD